MEAALQMLTGATEEQENQPKASSDDVCIPSPTLKMLKNSTEVDVQNISIKTRRAFGILNPIWKIRTYSLKTKLRLLRTNVKTVLFYGCETWKVTANITNKLQVFVNKGLRKILRIF